MASKGNGFVQFTILIVVHRGGHPALGSWAEILPSWCPRTAVIRGFHVEASMACSV